MGWIPHSYRKKPVFLSERYTIMIWLYCGVYPKMTSSEVVKVKDLCWMASIWKLNVACHLLHFDQAEDIWLKSAMGRKEGSSLTTGRKIAWGRPKISPKGRSLGQDFLNPRRQDRRVQLIILGLKRPTPVIAKAIALDPPTDFSR